MSIGYANARLYVAARLSPYSPIRKIHAFRADGERDPAADFELHVNNTLPSAIAYGDDRIYVLDRTARRAYAYRTNGQYDPAADVVLGEDDLNPVHDGPMMFANDRLYIRAGNRLLAYGAGGLRDPAADLGPFVNFYDAAYANGRLIFHTRDDMVVARTDGQIDPAVEFDLYIDNSNPDGIAYGDGQFYVYDFKEGSIYVYRADWSAVDDNDGVGSGITGYATDEEISPLPAASWTPDTISGGRASLVNGSTGIRLDNRGYFEVGGRRYTCRDPGSCEIVAGTVASGTIVRTPGGAALPDARPEFETDLSRDVLTYTADAAIDALTFPAASGGDDALSYTLTPEVPGLVFDPIARTLTGKPYARGEYAMIYTATDSDGDSDHLAFTIVVEPSFDSPPDVFDLAPGNGAPTVGGIVHINDRIYVQDGNEHKMFAYRTNGERDTSADLHIDDRSRYITVQHVLGRARQIYAPGVVAYADGRLYNYLGGIEGTSDSQKIFYFGSDLDSRKDLVGGDPHEVFRIATETRDFTPSIVVGGPSHTAIDESGIVGMVHADGRFYVVQTGSLAVSAFRANWEFDAAASFRLFEHNSNPNGIAFGDGRLYVVDSSVGRIFAYRVDGQRDDVADIELHADNDNPIGITYADGRLYVLDYYTLFTGDPKVYVYPERRQGDDVGGVTAFGAGDTIAGLPSGAWVPDALSAGRVNNFGRITSFWLTDQGYVEEGDFRYTCRGGGTCIVDNGRILSGAIDRTLKGVAPPPVVQMDARPAFAAMDAPGDLNYTAGQDIEPMMLPTASGGDGALNYQLAPEVPGLQFDATTRRLSGAPTWQGTYLMTYSVSDTDRDTDTLNFTIDVEASENPGAVEQFDLRLDYFVQDQPMAFPYAPGRFFVVDEIAQKVYAYSRNGVLAADFDLHPDNDFAHAITYANDRFYVLDDIAKKVFAYRPDGRRDETAEFGLLGGITRPAGIAYRDGRFYVVENYHDKKVFVFYPDGRRDEAADFDLHDRNTRPSGIAYHDGRFYVYDDRYPVGKVYAYDADGRHVEADDFEPFRGNGVIGVTDDGYLYLGSREVVHVYHNNGQHVAGFYLPFTNYSASRMKIAYAGDRIQILDQRFGKVYAYRDNGELLGVTSDLGAVWARRNVPQSANQAVAFTYANERYYVLTRDYPVHKVLAFRPDGQPDEAADFELELNGAEPIDIDFAEGRFYVLMSVHGSVNRTAIRIDAYGADGRRDPSADVVPNWPDLELGHLTGLAYAGGRFYVSHRPRVDGGRRYGRSSKVYAFLQDGQRDPSADFDLHEYNGAPTGLAYADGRFYVRRRPAQGLLVPIRRATHGR